MARLNRDSMWVLDRILKMYFDEQKGKECREVSFEEVEERMRNYQNYSYLSKDEHLGAVNIHASFKRLCKRNLVSLTGHSFIIMNFVFFNSNFTTITKNRNILTFEGCPELKYDCITKTWNMPLNMIDFTGRDFRYILKGFSNFNEWIFNYCHDLYEMEHIIGTSEADELISESIQSMPKGLYQKMQEYGMKELTAKFLGSYIYKMEFGKYSEFAKAVLHNQNPEKINSFLEDYTIKDLYTLANNSLLNGEFCWGSQNSIMRNFLQGYNEVKKHKLSIQVDINRSFESNIKNMKAILDKAKNEILSSQLKKLNFLHGRIIADYIIIVPQGIEDLVDEGKMQNNCVGHYYNSSIIKGQNLIYFLRKKDFPKDSYITCRYNISYKSTSEHRYKNNANISATDMTIVKLIDAIIRENLV